MRRRKIFTISVSLFAHAAVLALLFMREVPRKDPIPSAVMLELSQPSQSLPFSRPLLISQTKTAEKLNARHANSIPISALAPIHKPHLSNPPRPGEPRPLDAFPSAYSSSINPLLQETPETFGAYAWAHRQLQLGLGYPEPFRRHGIMGQTEARFAFSEAGILVPGSIRVKAESPYLRVYVHRLIEHTFGGSPVPVKLRKWKNSLELFCFVQFALVESETAVSLNMPTPIMGNRLFFARQSSDGKNQLDKLKWQVGPVHGFLVAPTVDMLWFARQAEELGKQKSFSDTLAPFRADPLFYN